MGNVRKAMTILALAATIAVVGSSVQAKGPKPGKAPPPPPTGSQGKPSSRPTSRPKSPPPPPHGKKPPTSRPAN